MHLGHAGLSFGIAAALIKTAKQEYGSKQWHSYAVEANVAQNCTVAIANDEFGAVGGAGTIRRPQLHLVTAASKSQNLPYGKLFGHLA